MRYLILLPLLACCSASTPPKQIAEVEQCKNVWSEMRPHVKEGWDVVDLTPVQVRHFVAGVNKEPPETDYVADEVHITQRPGAPIAFAYFVEAGCVTHAIQVPTEVLPALIAGQGSSL